MAEGPLDRLRANATGVVSMAVTAVWMGALFTDQEWWLAALLVGYVFVVPLSGILFGEDEEATGTADEDATADGEDPLEKLRRRYAEGELTEAEFERKVERLLATEDEDDADVLLDADRDGTHDDRERDRDAGGG